MPQLEVLYQLMSSGVYKLKERYMSSEEGLIDVTGVLNTELVSELSANGKYFVFTTTMPKAKIVSVLGNKLVSELGDIITLESMEKSQIQDLVHTLCGEISSKCSRNLCLKVHFADSALKQIGNKYSEASGIKGLEKQIDESIYEPLSEMKLQDVFSDGQNVYVGYKDKFYIRLKDGRRISIEKFAKN